MNIAEKEYKKRSTHKQTKKQNQTLPKWFNDNNESEEASEEEVKKMEEMLSKFK